MTIVLTTGIIDVSHWESDDLHGKLDHALATAKKAGVVAVIAKATQGKDYVDPSWLHWAHAVRNAGLLFGAYHFGSNTESGELQADWFLQHVRDAHAGLDALEIASGAPGTLLALDFERNPNPTQTMTVDQARAFAQRIRAEAHVWPLLYGDTSFLGHISSPTDALGNCALWPAAYGGSNPRIPPAWHDWALWQYTDGTYGPVDVATYPRITAGFGRIDRSAYKGTVDDLTAFWKTVSY